MIDINKIVNESIKSVAKDKEQSADIVEISPSIISAEKPSDINVLADEFLDEKSKQKKEELGNNLDVNRILEELVSKAVSTAVESRQIDIRRKDANNKIADYEIQCDIEKLRLRTQLEKKVIRQEVEADIEERKAITFLKKYNNAIKRYGHLYELESVQTIDENGNQISVVRPKDFVISPTINRIRSLMRSYSNLGDSTKKGIKATIKVLFWGGGGGLIIYLIIKAIKWLITSGIINIAIGG